MSLNQINEFPGSSSHPSVQNQLAGPSTSRAQGHNRPLDLIAPVASQPGNETFARRQKSSLSRQGSSTISAQDRAAQSARRKAIKEQIKKTKALEAQAERPGTNILARGFRFIANKLAPFAAFGTDANSKESSEDSMSEKSGSEDDDDLSDAKTEIVETGTDGPELDSQSTTYVNGRQPLLRNQPSTSSVTYAELRRIGEIHRAQLERAEAHARKEELKRRTRDRQYEWMKDTFGEKYALLETYRQEMAEKRRQLQEKHIERLEDVKDLEVRKALLDSGRREAIRSQTRREKKIRRREERLLKTLGLNGLEESSDEGYRDHTTKSRKLRQHFHPYPRRPRRPKTSRYFNPYEILVAAPTTSDNEVDRHEAIVSEAFERYEDQWRQLADPTAKVELTFRTVPWPLQFPPHSLDAFTVDNIWEFVLIGHLSEREEVDTAECSNVAMYELERWTPANVANWILPRIADKQEREVVRVAADLILKALVRLDK